MPFRQLTTRMVGSDAHPFLNRSFGISSEEKTVLRAPFFVFVGVVAAGAASYAHELSPTAQFRALHHNAGGTEVASDVEITPTPSQWKRGLLILGFLLECALLLILIRGRLGHILAEQALISRANQGISIGGTVATSSPAISEKRSTSTTPETKMFGCKTRT